MLMRNCKAHQATEPENRLVAAELEKRWNDAFTHLTEMERRSEEVSALTSQLTAEQRQQLLARRTRQRLRIRVPASPPSFVNGLQTGLFGIWCISGKFVGDLSPTD
jgi:hypothetical protein